MDESDARQFLSCLSICDHIVFYDEFLELARELFPAEISGDDKTITWLLHKAEVDPD